MTLVPAGLLLVSLLAASPEGPRVALLVGNDMGFAEELPLRSTGADAERLAAVLVELGGFAPGDVHLLKNRTAAEILDAVDLLARGPAASTLLFFYSGHADAGALHPGGTLLPVDLLLHRLHAVGADLRLTILDACQSGAAARAKGSRPAAPFEVRVEEPGPSGDILISSSAVDEASFEGEHGGLFTLSWTVGLRGAADANGDGRVTLGEAYEYAYAQTLRSTLAASSGPQHARFHYDLSGRRDPVLTQLSAGCHLTLQPQSDGEFVLFDGPERAVVAELAARGGSSPRLTLAPGSYVVRHRSVKALRLARVRLEPGDDRLLPEHQMAEVPLLRLVRKGSLGERRITASAGPQSSGLGPRGQLLAAAGVGWEGAAWLPGLELAFSTGNEVHGGLVTRDLLLQLSGSVLHATRLGGATLQVGPAAGVAYLRQDPAGQAARSSPALSAGARLVLELGITPVVAIQAVADGRLMALGMAHRKAGIGVVPWGALAVGLSIAP